MVQSSVASLACDHHFDNATSNVRPPCYSDHTAAEAKHSSTILHLNHIFQRTNNINIMKYKLYHKFQSNKSLLPKIFTRKM